MLVTNVLREPDVWALMCNRFPWVELALGEDGEGLIQVEFATLRRGLERAADSGDVDAATAILSFVDDLLGKPEALHHEVIRAIDESILSDLYLGEVRRRDFVARLLAPATRGRWNRIVQGSEMSSNRSRCPVCRGSGLDPTLHRRYTTGGRDDRTCGRCDGEGHLDPAGEADLPDREETADGTVAPEPITVVIYIPLSDEGVECWRPAAAEHVDGDVYRVRGPVPDTETWAFQPGALVRCKERSFEGGQHGLTAVELV